MHSQRFLLECYWLIYECWKYAACKVWRLLSPLQWFFRVVIEFHWALYTCSSVPDEVCVVIGLAMQPRVCVMWRLNLGVHLFMPDFISTLCILDCPSVLLVFFKKFWYPDSRIIILSVYQFSLYSFRDYLSTYKQLCIVAFLPQRNRSKICMFCISLFQYNVKIFSYPH